VRLEGIPLALDAVRVALAACSGCGGIDGEHEGALRQEAFEHGHVEHEHFLETEPPRDPLVRERRVDEAVAHDVRAARDRRPDHLGRVFGPGGGEQSRLGPRRHLGTVEDELPDTLAELGPARLPGRDHLAAEPEEVLLQEPGLGRLPRPVDPLDAHEHPYD
jgi:hypothetical protein